MTINRLYSRHYTVAFNNKTFDENVNDLQEGKQRINKTMYSFNIFNTLIALLNTLKLFIYVKAKNEMKANII